MQSELGKQYAQFFDRRSLLEIADGARGAADSLSQEGEHGDARVFRQLAIFAKAVAKDAA